MVLSVSLVPHVLCKKCNEQGTFLCNNLFFWLEIAFRYCYIFFGMVFLRKRGSAKASALFRTFENSEKIVICMGYYLTIIDV